MIKMLLYPGKSTDIDVYRELERIKKYIFLQVRRIYWNISDKEEKVKV